MTWMKLLGFFQQVISVFGAVNFGRKRNILVLITVLLSALIAC